ncbi:twin-arginine translocation signal domain-containing protein [Streptomyces paradoxus]|uniref:twin-arginine translocation signal domain-containing protein n=1 Tax=Streptomyces paradoxus TaxID=66375 RepID=UPI0038211355
MKLSLPRIPRRTSAPTAAHRRGLSRRALLGRVAAVGGAVGVAALPLSHFLSQAYADANNPIPARVRDALRSAQDRTRRVLAGSRSHNGWEMENVSDDGGTVYTRPVPGTPLKGVAVRMGDVETVLVHLVRRFHYEVDPLRRGDVVGWHAPAALARSRPESNLASGTAVRIRPGFYPRGARGGFFPQQEVVIRDILAELDGVVRWGGDDRTPDESLFSVDVRPGDEKLARVAARIRGWRLEPGAGAGSVVNVLSGGRRKAARALERRQRSMA